MLRVGVLIGVLFTWLVLAGFGHAGLIFEFAVGGTPQAAIQIPGVGATVPIQVYLRQTDGETILTSEGLDFAGIQVSFGSPAGIAAVTANNHIQPGPGFDLITDPPVFTATTAELDELAPLTVFDDANRILLGTFTFTGLALGTTSISVTDLTGGDDLVTGLGNALDSLITSGSATLTVTPEPSSVALSLLVVGAASVVTTYRARRKRKQQATADGAPLVAT
jgi:hypothetical protein